MKLSLMSLTAAILVLPSLAYGAEYEIDSTNSVALFSVKHMMVSNVRGTFAKVTGTAHIDEKDLTKSKVDATIDATTVNTNDAKRDEHLRAPDFFDTATYPTITFKSTKVEKARAGLKVTGNLTIRGVTKPVVLDVDGFDTVSKDPYGNTKRGGAATTKINRKDFGLSWNALLETGGMAVGEEVTITLDIQMNQKRPAQPAPAATNSAP